MVTILEPWPQPPEELKLQRDMFCMGPGWPRRVGPSLPAATRSSKASPVALPALQGWLRAGPMSPVPGAWRRAHLASLAFVSPAVCGRSVSTGDVR